MEMREEDIELLWRYIDGQCSKDEQLQVSELLTSDVRWKHAYDEILAFNQTLLCNTELEQPSLRFTQNIMDAVQAETFVHKRYTSRNLVWIFSFVLAALALVSVATGFTNIDWSSGKSLWHFKIDRSQLIFTTLAINTILVLVLIDTLLKRKRTGNS